MDDSTKNNQLLSSLVNLLSRDKEGKELLDKLYSEDIDQSRFYSKIKQWSEDGKFRTNVSGGNVKNIVNIDTVGILQLLLEPNESNKSETISFEEIRRSIIRKRIEYDLKSYPSMSTSKVPSKYYKLLTAILSIFIIVTIISLSLTYISSFSSEPWQEYFDKVGWVFELIRGFIFIGIAGLLGGYIFPNESYEMISIFNIKSDLKLTVARVSLVFFCIWTLVLVVHHHLETGPQLLYESQPRLYDKNIYHELYEVPYLTYLPYSVINFVFIGMYFVIAGIYASAKDLVKLRIAGDIVSQNVTAIRKMYNEKTSNRIICNVIEEDFERLVRFYISIIGRYTYLFLSVNVLVFCEIIITILEKGQLFDVALVWTGLGFFFLLIVSILVLFGFYFYESSLSKSSDLLYDVGCQNRLDFEEKNTSRKFLSNLLKNYISIFIGLTIFMLSFATLTAYKIFQLLT